MKNFNDEKCKEFYNSSYNFLLEEILIKEKKLNRITKTDIDEKYLKPKKPDSLQDLFEKMIDSAQNNPHMSNTIKFNDRRIQEQIKKLLSNFVLPNIVEKKPEELYEIFQTNFNFEGNANNEKQGSWYKWSRSIVDSARFFSDLKDIKEFEEFIALFQINVQTRIALALLISARIYGIGFASACNFLKETGNTNFAKPDVHIKDILKEVLKLDSETELSDISAFEIIVDIAKKSGHSPYELDKILWLICSGNFDKDHIKVKSRKKDFLRDVCAKTDIIQRH